MPIPLSDVTQAYRSAPERTEQALTKVRMLLFNLKRLYILFYSTYNDSQDAGVVRIGMLHRDTVDSCYDIWHMSVFVYITRLCTH